MDSSDPSTFNHQYFNANGLRLHYVDENQSATKALLLIHGWPDLWLGWREQIPFLAKLGYRVIVPTIRGYGESDGPADAAKYTDKYLTADLDALLDHLQIPTVVVLGHDWGGLVAWRFAQFYPNRVEAVASFCTPYLVPNTERITLEQFVEKFPNFTYQLHLVSPKAEEEINAHTEAFFKRFFRPVGEIKEPLIDPNTKTMVEGRADPPKSDAVSQKVLDYYVSQYRQRGAGTSLNLYKRFEYQFEDNKGLDPIIDKPALMVTSEGDRALPPAMAHGMEKYIPKVEFRNIEGAGHWVLWEKPAECNKYLEEWLPKVYPA
ncbi:alpha/beta-hydrolase [Lichtheimia hyalospora FSU 10163]|nr:alpha/beta-hydrolase [Lichtheimia hyalospora FSU 10163]